MRSALLLTVLAGLLGLVVYDSVVERRATRSSAATVAGASGRQDDSTPLGADRHSVKLELPERAPLSQSRTGLFSSHSWLPSASRAAPTKPAPVALVPPPMPYRFAGALVQDGKLQVLLATGNTVVPVREGETIDGGYRVDSIGEDQITLTYLPLKKKEVIPFFSSLLPAVKRDALARVESYQIGAPRVSSAAASSPSGSGGPQGPVRAKAVVKADAERGNDAPARLLWHGPNRVQLGKEFTVSLRVTSAQPVRASPMQIKVNPALLETVAVKPGRFFGDGDRNFGYRVNADGSIFVAATSPNPTPAADAEFVVLTFIPRKTASAAELTIASLNLQGPAGRPIAFGPPEAFRTAIGP
jgi:hypothetical protein